MAATGSMLLKTRTARTALPTEMRPKTTMGASCETPVADHSTAIIAAIACTERHPLDDDDRRQEISDSESPVDGHRRDQRERHEDSQVERLDDERGAAVELGDAAPHQRFER